MKINRIKYLVNGNSLLASTQLKSILNEIEEAIISVKWPLGSNEFVIYPEKKGNGVKPLKSSCMKYLEKKGWELEVPMILGTRNPGPVDAIKKISKNRYFVVEWETGNISSSHRALNKIALGLLSDTLAGGILILPSRELYQWLTDRVGNFYELEPYFPIWENLPIDNGILGVIEVEHDNVSEKVPRIKKGTDGRALR